MWIVGAALVLLCIVVLCVIAEAVDKAFWDGYAVGIAAGREIERARRRSET
jgi:hypothetical protein